jgi:REP element-mobilizing transposase RayT
MHVFVSCDGSGVLSKWTKGLKGVMSKSFREAGHSPPFWQASFFDHIMRSGDSYEHKWKYIVENPVRAGLVERAEDWPYSGELEILYW